MGWDWGCGEDVALVDGDEGDEVLLCCWTKGWIFWLGEGTLMIWKGWKRIGGIIVVFSDIACL